MISPSLSFFRTLSIGAKRPRHRPNRILAPRRIVLPGYSSQATARLIGRRKRFRPRPCSHELFPKAIANCPHSSYAHVDSLYLEAMHNLTSPTRPRSSSRDSYNEPPRVIVVWNADASFGDCLDRHTGRHRIGVESLPLVRFGPECDFFLHPNTALCNCVAHKGTRGLAPL